MRRPSGSSRAIRSRRCVHRRELVQRDARLDPHTSAMQHAGIATKNKRPFIHVRPEREPNVNAKRNSHAQRCAKNPRPIG
ncbi:hypothetical protein BURMUCF2_A0670 [Burkholderia multivorans CF2]|nr:hypothetical protein BURMUCF2_A0670 [Burkholderia multivorans CF2]